MNKKKLTPVIIRDFINESFDVDISTKSRGNHSVQLRRIYYKLCDELTFGFSDVKIADTINRHPAGPPFHLKRFHLVEGTSYMSIYYQCLDALTGSNTYQKNVVNLPVEKKEMSSIIAKLKTLSNAQLLDFERTRLDTYILMNSKNLKT